MVRLRLLHLDPDFVTPTAEIITKPMPVYSNAKRVFEGATFEERYLLEALLSHGTVTVPEVLDTWTTINRYRYENRLHIMEGLFKWTRVGSIDEDIRRESCPIIIARYDQ